MSNKLTEKLLQGYELKSAAFDKKTAQPTPQPAPAKPQQAPVEVPKPAAPLAEGESYTISDKPDKFVCSIFESFQSFEQRSSAIAGKAYIFAATLILTALLWLKQEVLTQLPAVEVIFVAFLVTFIFNYYLINGALYKPFIENEQNSYLIKLCGAFAVASVACFFYALRFVELQNALIVFYSAFFLVIVLEAIFLKESFKPFELITALGALVGTIITINGASGTFWSESTPSDPSAIYGLVLAAVSAVCMALIMFNFSKMQAENFATMNHIFTMMIVLFVPIFFPIQGVVTPSLGQWVVLLICGLLTAFASLFFIRSFQLDSGARPAVYLFLQTAFIFGIEYLMSQASGFTSVIGAIITVACVGLYSQQYSGKASAQGLNDKEKGFYQEMNVINSN